jgi:3-hydroxybutyryl-CoA dehydratase
LIGSKKKNPSGGMPGLRVSSCRERRLWAIQLSGALTHVNAKLKNNALGGRVAHGPLTQSLAAPLLGMKLPGPGAIAVEITTRFKAPVYIGDTITVTAEVVEKIPTKRWVRISLTWQNQKAELVEEGSVIVSPPRKEA